jgi:hypothetical protein
MNFIFNNKCKVCNQEIEGDYLFHLITSHLDTYISMMSVYFPQLEVDDVLELVNQYVEMYTSDNNYENLMELCDNIGYYKKGINNIDTVCKKVEVVNTEETCPVCLEMLLNKDTYKIKTCKHIFCKECITKWLSDNISCPICKNELTNEI